MYILYVEKIRAIGAANTGPLLLPQIRPRFSTKAMYENFFNEG
jgi:hypothetical protein